MHKHQQEVAAQPEEKAASTIAPSTATQLYTKDISVYGKTTLL
jgi:hypothetical protein